MDLTNTYITFHSTIVLILTGLILSLSIWGVRCFRVGLNPAHRNVKLSYLTVLALVWAFIMFVLTI
jgi:hypothetical protein